MKKYEVIDKLFEEFIKDKATIKKTLMQDMDIVMLETKNKDLSVTMTIRINRNDKK